MGSHDSIEDRPKLRPVEAFSVPGDHDEMIAVRDPTGLAEAVLTVSEPALFILSRLDGTRTLGAVRDEFQVRYGQLVEDSTLENLVTNLRTAHLLDGPEFSDYLEALVAAYQAAPVRESVYATELGSATEVSELLSNMLSGASSKDGNGEVVGLIAPHLDYARGKPCYADAYGMLVGRPAPKRAVILGTNHFGEATSVVATGKSFQTPLGVTRVDGEFLDGIEDQCGYLRADEFDHRREHSIELQVLWLQHLFGADGFAIVPFLCPDPCGPTGTKPCDGKGVDLRDFAEALAAVIGESDGETLVIAGADLSHVGSKFGDDFKLEEDFLASIEHGDLARLSHLEKGQPDDFVRAVAKDGNPTRICSAGCIFVAATVLRDAKPELLRYHQAFDEQNQVCVSCSAVAYTR